MADTATGTQANDTTSKAGETGTQTGNDAASKTVTQTQTATGQAHQQAAPAPMTPEAIGELVAKGIADAQAKWETERLPKLRAEVAEAVTAPIRRDAKIKSLREELRSAGKYLPADDDNSDPTSPGDIAALCDLDDTAIVAKDKTGNGLTRLDVELKRVRERLGKRTAVKTGKDDLATPPVEVKGDELDAIAAETRKYQESRRATRGGAYHDIYGGPVPPARR